MRVRILQPMRRNKEVLCSNTIRFSMRLLGAYGVVTGGRVSNGDGGRDAKVVVILCHCSLAGITTSC